jgi:hypothetical protein
MNNETEAIIKIPPTKEIPGSDEFTIKFYQTFRETLTSMLLKPFHIIERKGTQSNSFYEVSLTLILRLDKDT